MESILNSVKTAIGVGEQHEYFDSTLIPLINAQFAILNDEGVGPEEVFTIDSAESKWSDFTQDAKVQRLVREWVGLKVKLTFDPPANGTIVDTIKETIKEVEWRMYNHCDLVNRERGENNAE